MVLKETILLKKDVNALKPEISKSAQKTFFDVSELYNIVKLFKSNLEKIVNSSKNLDLMLGSQRPYFEKSRLGYEKEENEKLSKSSQGKVPTCIYCFKKGHSSEKCFSRRKAKKQKVKNPKKATNSKGPKKMWVPKVKVVSDAGVSQITSSEGDEMVFRQWLFQTHNWKHIGSEILDLTMEEL